MQGTLARHFLLPGLPEFFDRYPDIDITMREGDRWVDLVREGVDAVLRFGHLYGPGSVYAPDGSLTITISHARPGDATAAANWLPAPPGAFRPVLRMYEPAPEVLDQAYSVPPITRT